MPKHKSIKEILSPVRDTPIQAYFGQGVHSLGLLHWLLAQTGNADVLVSSYSTSEAFLNGFYLLRKKGLIRQASILLDIRAARKTLQLERLLISCFDHVFLGQNHSKLMLLKNENMAIAVVSSQNQTYGARAESTLICTDRKVYDVLVQQFDDITKKHSTELNLTNGKGIISKN